MENSHAIDDDWLLVYNTYGDKEYVRRSAVAHLRTTRNGKTAIELHNGTVIWSRDPIDLTADLVIAKNRTRQGTVEIDLDDPHNPYPGPYVASRRSTVGDDIPF